MPASVLKRDLKNLIQRNASLNFQAQNGLLSLRSWWRSVRSLPLSVRLRGGIRFLPHPFPAIPLASFAGSLPSRGDSGVTSFTFSIDPGVRSCLSAGGATSATGDQKAPVPDHVPFGSSLTASLACSQ